MAFFLQKEWHDIYELTQEAESCIWSKPLYACLINRKALEKAVIWMYKNDADLTMPYYTSLNSLLHEESFIKVICCTITAVNTKYGEVTYKFYFL